MVDTTKLVKWALFAFIILGVAMVGISIWAMIGPIKILPNGMPFVEETGNSPKLAISAGVFMFVIAIVSICVKFENRAHLIIARSGILLILSLTIAAMSVAIKDLQNIDDVIKVYNILYPGIDQKIEEYLKPVQMKLIATAVVSGLSVGYEIVTGALLVIAMYKPG